MGEGAGARVLSATSLRQELGYTLVRKHQDHETNASAGQAMMKDQDLGCSRESIWEPRPGSSMPQDSPPKEIFTASHREGRQGNTRVPPEGARTLFKGEAPAVHTLSLAPPQLPIGTGLL